MNCLCRLNTYKSIECENRKLCKLLQYILVIQNSSEVISLSMSFLISLKRLEGFFFKDFSVTCIESSYLDCLFIKYYFVFLGV